MIVLYLLYLVIGHPYAVNDHDCSRLRSSSSGLRLEMEVGYDCKGEADEFRYLRKGDRDADEFRRSLSEALGK